MRKFVFIWIQIAFIASVYSQDFLKEGLMWNNTNGGSYSQYLNFIYKVQGDTTINSINYKIIKENYPNLDSNWISKIYAREDSNKWYFRFPNDINNEKLYYDFSVNEGDTVSIYNFQTKEYFYYADVASIDSITLSNGEKRKRINFHLNNDVWVEGLGSIITHLDKPCLYTYMVDIALLNLCTKQNDTLLFSQYPNLNCHDTGAFTTSLIEIAKNNNVSLYPNPSKDNISFNCSSMINNIDIFNIMGERVYKTNVKDKVKTIDISSFRKGMYIAKLYTEQGIIDKKFIVE